MHAANKARQRPTTRTLTQRVGYSLLRNAARLGGVVAFGMQLLGRHHIPASGGVLVCSNHQSVMDPVLVGLAFNRRLNYLARRSLFQAPLFSALIRVLDAIPIDREGLGLEGIKETIRRLWDGEMVLIFPEGTRTETGQLGPLKPGLCAVAKRSRALLLPVGLDGAFQAWPRGAVLPRPGHIVMQFGPVITTADVQRWTNDELLAELERRMRWCHSRARSIRQRTCAGPSQYV
jgi:1-acyl-sn-glycerol-3-phosphate acyltransferase